MRLTRPAPFSRDQTATVSSAGAFTFFGVPVGDYNLSLSVTGSPLRGSTMGTIGFDADVDEPRIQLAPATSVLGSIAKPNEAGGTVAAGNVVVTLTGGNIFLSTLTVANGAFTIGGVPEGAFTLKAQDPLTGGIATAPVAIDLPELPPFAPVALGTLVLDLEPIQVATVTPGAGATLVPPDSNVVLTFSDPFAQAEVPGRFFVRSGGVNVPGTATVSPDGLTLTFDPTLYHPPNAVVAVFVSKDLADTFGRKLGTDFTSSFATGGAVVTGVVTSQGAPVSGASVVFTNGAGSISTSTDAAGRYRFENVAAGAASIVASDGGLAGSRVVDIGPATGVVAADIPIAFVAAISGRVFQFDNSPAGAGLEV
ncbi:MAG: Ig-like domain-containing protein, partial [Thermoplasmata archaeon]